jgi:hypothetical protein
MDSQISKDSIYLLILKNGYVTEEVYEEEMEQRDCFRLSIVIPSSLALFPK